MEKNFFLKNTFSVDKNDGSNIFNIGIDLANINGIIFFYSQIQNDNLQEIKDSYLFRENFLKEIENKILEIYKTDIFPNASGLNIRKKILEIKLFNEKTELYNLQKETISDNIDKILESFYFSQIGIDEVVENNILIKCNIFLSMVKNQAIEDFYIEHPFIYNEKIEFNGDDIKKISILQKAIINYNLLNFDSENKEILVGLKLKDLDFINDNKTYINKKVFFETENIIYFLPTFDIKNLNLAINITDSDLMRDIYYIKKNRSHFEEF